MRKSISMLDSCNSIAKRLYKTEVEYYIINYFTYRLSRMKLVDLKMLVLTQLLGKEIGHTSYDLYAISVADHYVF